MEPISTLKPSEVAVVMVEFAIAKHRTRADKIFIKAFIAGVLLSFGGLLSEIISGGSPALNTSNPGLVKILGGFVFPVGLVMIVLGGYELLTSNMMVFPMALVKRAVPWWGLPLNWVIVTFGNLVGSLFFAAIITKCEPSVPHYSSRRTHLTDANCR
jgi:formate/nitrite transporter FocA (FNT family)